MMVAQYWEGLYFSFFASTSGSTQLLLTALFLQMCFILSRYLIDYLCWLWCLLTGQLGNALLA